MSVRFSCIKLTIIEERKKSQGIRNNSVFVLRMLLFALREEVGKHLMSSYFTWVFFLTSTLQNSLRMLIFWSICLSLIWIGLILGAGISLTSPYLSNLTKHGKLFACSSSSSSSSTSSELIKPTICSSNSKNNNHLSDG